MLFGFGSEILKYKLLNKKDVFYQSYLFSAKQDIVVDSQLPQGMSGEKLKELEKGFIPEAKPEEKVPTEPPKFITQVSNVVLTRINKGAQLLDIMNAI